MAFVKVLKNTSYFKRFQVKKRRRREGKTDYKARRKMVRQDKNKFNNRKYRLIVRFTNSKCICQIAYATLRGDMVICQANSAELKGYGIPAGYKNYAAAYCTGLLVARRLLTKFDLASAFTGVTKADGKDYNVADGDHERRPFAVNLDVGLQRTIQGARLWGALKGAVDGGLNIPHNHKNFPGYKAAEGKGGKESYEAEAHKNMIFGNHLKEYMEMLKEEDDTKYEAHFAKYIKAGTSADKLQDMYTKAHAAIRAKPGGVAKKGKGITVKSHKDGQTTMSDGKAHARNRKIGLEARKAKVLAKIQKFAEAADDE